MFKLIPRCRVKVFVEDLLHIKWANTRHFSNVASILVPIYVSYVSRLKTIQIVRVHSRGLAEAWNMLSRRLQKFLVKDCVQSSSRDCHQTKKARSKAGFLKKHQHDAAYRHRGQILVTLHLSIETVSVTTRQQTKTKRKSVRSAQYVQRWQPRANVWNFEEKTIVQQIKRNNYSIS